jgi:hypothetical protein
VWNTKVSERLEQAGWQHSIVERMIKTIRAVVKTIDEERAWQHIEYPDDREGAARRNRLRPRAIDRPPYAQTLNRLAVGVGGGRALDADVLDGAVQGAWGACAPATWNRHVATVRSFVAFCRRRGWMGADVDH